MNLSMTTEEIKSRYKSMASKQDRIGILADLNGCSRKDVEEVLGLNKPPETAVKQFSRWTEEEEARLIDMVKAGKSSQEVSKMLGRSLQATIQKAFTLGQPFKRHAAAKKPAKKKCADGICEVPEKAPAVSEIKLLPMPTDYPEVVKNIADQLVKLIKYADELSAENDRLTRQLARVREAVE